MPDVTSIDPRVTVGIVTKDRPDSLARCLQSLALIGANLTEVIVIDDSGAAPLVDVLQSIPQPIAGKLRLLRQTSHEGYIVARNRIMREATTDYVLLMDDDAWLLDGDGVREGLALLAQCARLGAVAYAMAGADGTPWADGLQPAAVRYRCLVPSFIGFAHLLRPLCLP